MGRAGSGTSTKLDAVVFRPNAPEQNRNGLKWYGEVGTEEGRDREGKETTRKVPETSKILLENLYDDDKLWMDYEEDEEGNAKGADRKSIKVINVDFRGSNQCSRSDTTQTLSNFEASTG